MLKERRSLIGDLIVSPKSQIIWDSRGQKLVVLTKEVGEPCCKYVQEEYASRFSGHREASQPHKREHPPSFEVLALMVSLTASSDAPE